MTTETKKAQQQEKTVEQIREQLLEDEVKKALKKKTKAELAEIIVTSRKDTRARYDALAKESGELVRRQAFLEQTTRNQYAANLAKEDECRQAKSVANFWRRTADAYRVILLAKKFERMVEDPTYQKFCEVIMRDGATMKVLTELEKDPAMVKYADEVRAALEAEKVLLTVDAEEGLKAARNWQPA